MKLSRMTTISMLNCYCYSGIMVAVDSGVCPVRVPTMKEELTVEASSPRTTKWAA